MVMLATNKRPYKRGTTVFPWSTVVLLVVANMTGGIQ
jgi:hypothetical protein